MTQFNQRIKYYRKEKKLTQKQMAEMFGITERNYQYYESAAREPNAETLCNIADVLDISIDFLLGRTDKMDAHKL